MGEAILAKSVGYKIPDPLDSVDVVPGYCSLLVTAKDSGGNFIPNLPVHCKDGSTWYNYNTNEKGMALFQCNSGSANITAWNYSILDGYNIIDQAPATMNVDAPTSTKKSLEISLVNVTGNLTFTASKTNLRFLDTPEISFLQMIGGGAGGLNGNLYSGNYYICGGNGGGGGAANIQSNIKIDRSTLYNITIGAGGAIGGGAGGTTSAFGYSAIGGSGGNGGGSGDLKGGDGGKPATGGPTVPNYANYNIMSGSYRLGTGGYAGLSGGKYQGSFDSGWIAAANNNSIINGSLGGGDGGTFYYGYWWNEVFDFIANNGSAAKSYGCGGGGGPVIVPSNAYYSGGKGYAGIVFVTI